MSWNIEIDGKSFERVGKKIIYDGMCWTEETYVKGKHPFLGEQIDGETGPETISKTIIPSSLVDSSIKVNGESNARLQHLVAPEFRYLIEPTGQPQLTMVPSIVEAEMTETPVPQYDVLVEATQLVESMPAHIG